MSGPGGAAGAGSRLPTAGAAAALAVTVLLCWLPWAGLFGGPDGPGARVAGPPLWVDVAVLPDPGGALDAAGALAARGRFRPLPRPGATPGPPPGEEGADDAPGAFWFLLRPMGVAPPGGTIVEMNNPAPRDYLLVLPEPDGTPAEIRLSGRFVRFELPGTGSGEFLVRAEAGQGPPRPPRLLPALAHAGEQGRKGMALGMFYGGILVLAAVNILFGLLLGEAGHAWYAASLAFLGGAFFLGLDDVAGASLTGSMALAVPVRVLGVGWLFCSLGLIRSFLQTGRRAPRLDAALRGLLWLLPAAAPALFLLSGRQAGALFSALTAATALLALAAGRQALRQGFTPARLFLAAWLPALAFPLLPFVWRAARLGAMPPPGTVLSLVVLLQAALFTASLLGKVRTMLAENIRLQERRRTEARVMDEQRRLFSEISHELAGPLARLELGIELCARGETDDGLTRGMARDHAALAELRGQMLDLARIDGASGGGAPGGGRRGFALVDPTRLALAVAADAARQAGTEAVAVDSRDPAPLPGDAVLLRRALDNLVRNALLHAGPPVRILAQDEGDALVLAVRDQGPGVAEADLERIFEPFARAVPPGAAKVPGSGLGLSIVRRVAALHGGEAQARNLPGRGFEVRLVLPRGAREERQDP